MRGGSLRPEMPEQTCITSASHAKHAQCRRTVYEVAVSEAGAASHDKVSLSGPLATNCKLVSLDGHPTAELLKHSAPPQTLARLHMSSTDINRLSGITQSTTFLTRLLS